MVDRFVAAGAPEADDFGGAEGGALMRAEARRHAPALVERVAAMAHAFFQAGPD